MQQCLSDRSPTLRLIKAGLVGIGLAVTKVFIVDISGLDGLMRVVSLLGLGLVGWIGVAEPLGASQSRCGRINRAFTGPGIRL